MPYMRCYSQTVWRQGPSGHPSDHPRPPAAARARGHRGTVDRRAGRGRRAGASASSRSMELETDKAVTERARAARRRRPRRSRSAPATPSRSARCCCGSPRGPTSRSTAPGAPARRPPSRCGSRPRRRPRSPPRRARPWPSRPAARVAPVARRAAASSASTSPRHRDRARAAGSRSTTSRPPRRPPRRPPPAAEPPAAAAGALTATRRAIARRMTASQLIPQYHLRPRRRRDAPAGREGRAGVPRRRAGRRQRPAVQAIAETAVRHPALATVVRRRRPAALAARAESIDVGLAVATDRGLVVAGDPRGARAWGSPAIAAERRRLVAAARAGRLGLERDDRRHDHALEPRRRSASTASPRWSTPARARSSPSGARSSGSCRAAGRSRSCRSLTLTLSFDHRVVDGAVGGAALAELADLLEGGMTWRP